VGAENPVTLCDLHVFVDEAAESVSSEQPDRRLGACSGATRRRALIQLPMRAVGVDVMEILAQDEGKVPGSGDQELVEAFPA
jgi:hypothetical protein